MYTKSLRHKLVGALLGFFVIVMFFIGSSLLAHYCENNLQTIIGTNNILGMMVYVAITALAIILAPVSTLPLIPLAVAIWGWFITAILSIIGWTVGSQVAFWLAKTYGQTLVQKFVSLERFSAFEKRFTKRNLFWTVVLLRMTVPVDILSYGLGLFSTMSNRLFLLSTIIGITPFAFIFSYLGSLPPGFQIITIIEIVILLFIVHYVWKKQ